MISQEKLRKYVDIVEKYALTSYASMTYYPDGEIEVYIYIEEEIKFKYNRFSVYGGYDDAEYLKLNTTIYLDSQDNGVLPKEALQVSDAIKRCAFACQEINQLRIPYRTYLSVDFVEALKQEYKRRGKIMKVNVNRR